MSTFSRHDSVQSAESACGLRGGQEALDVPAARRVTRGADERADRLRITIESQVIPRLMLSARQTGRPDRPHRVKTANAITPSKVAELAHKLLSDDAAASIKLVARLHRGGVPLRSILQDLLAPAARQLGTFWEADISSFAEVTLAMGRLQQVLHWTERAAGESPELSPPHSQRRALFRAVSGDQHTFALHMLDMAFRRNGWSVEVDLSRGVDYACQIARKQRHDLIGISICRDGLLPALAADIRAIRAAAGRRPPVIIVGGRAILGRPELVTEVGADATADDAFAAVGLIDQLIPIAAAH
jgi:methanogenic corrinoid protein MtbC1